MTTKKRTPRRWIAVLVAAVFLVPALYGFGSKFHEFLILAGDPDGAFTIVPILNYLLASLGFIMLLGWAILHGMFRDIEKPKFNMLQQERMLDEANTEKER